MSGIAGDAILWLVTVGLAYLSKEDLTPESLRLICGAAWLCIVLERVSIELKLGLKPPVGGLETVDENPIFAPVKLPGFSLSCLFK